jgi:uncharacterized protein YlxW (UPF0749 family)
MFDVASFISSVTGDFECRFAKLETELQELQSAYTRLQASYVDLNNEVVELRKVQQSTSVRPRNFSEFQRRIQ